MFKQYRAKTLKELRPFEPGEILPETTTVTLVQRAGGSPKKGDFIARNPENHADQWLITAEYFADNVHPEPVGE